MLNWLKKIWPASQGDVSVHPRSQSEQSSGEMQLHLPHNKQDANPQLVAIAEKHNKSGDVLYEQQEFLNAEKEYRKALEYKPDFAEAQVNLGLCLDAQGRFAEALICYQGVIDVDSDNYLAIFNLAVTQTSLGDISQAQRAYEKIVQIRPSFYYAHFNLAILYQQQDRMDEAEAHYKLTLASNPQHFAAYCNLGMIYKQKELYEQAQEQFHFALRINSEHVESLNNLGLIAIKLHDIEHAVEYFQRALLISPDFAEVWVSLGDALKKQNKTQEAEASYKKAIVLQPGLAVAYCNLGVSLHERKQYEEAIAVYLQGIAQDTGSVLLYNNLGNAYCMINRLRDAEACYTKALEISAEVPETFTNIASLFAVQGRIHDAEKSYGKALKLNPQYAQAYSNRLFMLNYDPDRGGEEIFSAYQEYEKLFAKCHFDKALDFTNDRNRQRRLKIGYVSPDFCHHPVQYFLEPLMEHHDSQQIEVFSYAEIINEDDITQRYKTYSDHWINTTGMTDVALFERIREDDIDILVDLAGHTANNRLAVFARKPAPIQISWLGYGYTTGLTAIDYFLTDEVSAPPGSDALFAEHPWRLKSPAYAFRPAHGMGEISSLPALKNKHVRIGTLTRSIRINHKTIRVWSDILKRLKNAVLVVDSANYRDIDLREALIQKFAAHGIDASRLEIGFHSPPWDTLRNLDIGLDCFPHNSGTTLFETLYMGVPYVTLNGRPSLGCLGSTILNGLGHPEWIAHTEDEYVEKVVALAENIEQLASIRAGLREEMQNSALMDEPGFTRKVEEAYRAMWLKWCDAE